MHIFIDSADPDQIRQAYNWGFVSGVTTNPSLAARTGRPYSAVVQEILEILTPDSTISLETIALDTQGMVEQGRKLAKLDQRVIIKLPCTPAGITANKQLTSEGYKTNVTLVFSLNQALIAARTGAFYVSPFAGRLNDQQMGKGNELVSQIRQVYDAYKFPTKLLYASVRGVENVAKAALLGADIVTVPFEIIKVLLDHPMTTAGLDKFLTDWKQAKLSLPG